MNILHKITGLLRKAISIKTALIVFIFVAFVNQNCDAKKSYKIVILPFNDYAQMNMEEMVPDALRSMFTQTGYFEPVDREIIYEKVTTMIPGDQIKIDNITKTDGVWTADQVDLMAKVDTKIVKKFGRQLKADYILKGNISLIGSSLRIDTEIVGVKERKTLGFVVVEGNPEELSSGILKELSVKITSFCRNLNAYDDALSILGLYNQGQYTFDVSEKKLREILSITGDAVGIRASLIVLYLSRTSKEENSSLEDKILGEGVMVLRHLEQNFDEKVLEIFLTSGLDPFDEMAKIYSKRGDHGKAIELYKKTISVYPMNIAGRYKELGLLYLNSGAEDEAIQAFEKSLDTHKGNYEVNLILVSMFEKRKQPDKVRKHLEECVRYARNIEEIKAAKGKLDSLNP
ncbi:MAG: tetratricopeptide repeat protein [Candidatus Scalindua sp.]